MERNRTERNIDFPCYNTSCPSGTKNNIFLKFARSKSVLLEVELKAMYIFLLPLESVLPSDKERNIYFPLNKTSCPSGMQYLLKISPRSKACCQSGTESNIAGFAKFVVYTKFVDFLGPL